MELGYFLLGAFVIMCLMPIIESCVSYVNHFIALHMAKIEISIEEMKMDFQEKYGDEEVANQIGFCVGEEMPIVQDEDYLEEIEESKNIR